MLRVNARLLYQERAERHHHYVIDDVTELDSRQGEQEKALAPGCEGRERSTVVFRQGAVRSSDSKRASSLS